MGLRFSFLLFLQKKRNKEKGALSEVFFPIGKTVLETPRRRILRLLISLSGHPTRGRQAPSSEGRCFWVLVKSWLPSSVEEGNEFHLGGRKGRL
jgi:hypothetical protein